MSCLGQFGTRPGRDVKPPSHCYDLILRSLLVLLLILLAIEVKMILGTEISSSPSLMENWGADSTAPLTEHVEATISHQQELTTFTEAENEVFEPERGSMIAVHSLIANPYPAQEPSHLLSRNFRIGDITWSPTSVGYSFDFPEVLFAQTQIAATLESFQWFAADVQFEVRITSTPYHIGVMQISYIPCWAGSDPGVWQASGNHPTTLSFGTSDAATITIPYVNPNTWLDWATCPSSSIARVYLHSIVPLVNTSESTTDDCPVQIFASFKNVRVAGYLHTASSVAQRARKKNLITELTGRRIQFERKSTKQGYPNRRHVNAQMAVELKKKKKVISVADMDDHGGPEKEAEDKSVLGIMGDFSRSGIPILKSIGSFVTGVTSILKAFSIFDKPNNVTIGQRVMPVNSTDMPHGQGLSQAISLGLSPNTYLCSPGKIDPGETSSMAVCDLARFPMLHQVTQFDNSLVTQSNWVVQPQFFSNSSNQPDWLMAISDSYKYWRGSIKYLLCFYTTPFTTCRFRISANYATWTSDVIPSGDIVSKIVDVKGDTFVEMTIPYLSVTHWSKVRDPIYSGLPRVVVDELVPITGQSLDSDPYVFLVVYRSAGEDFQFAQLIHADPFVISVANKRKMTNVTAQMDIRQRFLKNFPHIIEGCSQSVEKGFVMAEVAGDIGSVLKRLAFIGIVATGSLIDQPQQTVTSVTSNEPFFMFSRYFLFWRGSRNVKVFNGATLLFYGMADFGAAPNIQSQAGSGMLVQAREYSFPLIDANIPWYCMIPYYPLQPTNMAIDYLSTSVPERGGGAVADAMYSQYISGGDDFQYLWVFPPPPYPSPSEERVAASAKTVPLSGQPLVGTNPVLSNDLSRMELLPSGTRKIT